MPDIKPFLVVDIALGPKFQYSALVGPFHDRKTAKWYAQKYFPGKPYRIREVQPMTARKPSKPTTCPWCGRERANNPGDYYHEKDCQRRDAIRRRDEARAAGDTEAIKQIEAEIEAASYVGD